MGSDSGPHPGSARTRGSLSILVTLEQMSILLQKGWEGRAMPPTPGDGFCSHCTEGKTEGHVGYLAARGHLASEQSYSDQSPGVADITWSPWGG